MGNAGGGGGAVVIPEAPSEPQDTKWCAPGEQTDGETEDKYIALHLGGAGGLELMHTI